MARFINKPAHKALIALLKTVRQEAGLTQIDVAQRLKGRQAWVSLIEVGQRRVDVVELLELLQAMNAEPRAFWARYLSSIRDQGQSDRTRTRR